jgi:hypothetical protein
MPDAISDMPVARLIPDVRCACCVYLAPAAAPPVLVLRFGGFVRFVLFMFMFMCFAQQPAAQQRPAPAPSGTSGQWPAAGPLAGAGGAHAGNGEGTS